MKTIKSGEELRGAIINLEETQEQEGKMLKSQFHLAYEGMKPVNIIKNTLRETVESLELKEGVIIAFIGMAAGYFSRKIIVGASHSPMRKLIGTAFMFGVTNLAAKHPEALKLSGQVVLKFISKMLRDGRRHSASNAEHDETSYIT
jgi:hypothetical protein